MIGRWLGRAFVVASLVLAPFMLMHGCSLQNSEGPEVTCEELQCGRFNACRDGIIAHCLDGYTVRYTVCHDGAADICESDWQNPDAYRCIEFETDCEACRPERVQGCALFDESVGIGGSGGSASGSGGAGGG